MKKIYNYLLNTIPRPILIRLSYVFKLFAPLLFKGDKVYCNVCNKKFGKFLSYGSKVAHRDNVLCPYDLTLERHRLMWYYLQNNTSFFTANKLKVLHIAPEQCFHKNSFNELRGEKGNILDRDEKKEKEILSKMDFVEP